MNESYMKLEKIVLYSDGGSRGNPGPSALGVFIETLGVRYGEFLGVGTNNEAEYMAILSGIRKTRELIGDDRAKSTQLECRMDSELAMRQLTGRYRVKNERLRTWFDKIRQECHFFSRVDFRHIPRVENKEADAMANKAMDAKSSVFV